jgi:hypothetical protein
VIAITSGIIGIVTVIVQVRLEQENTIERLNLEKELQEESAVVKEYQDFHGRAISILSRINYSLKEAYSDPTPENQKRLNDLIGDCWELIHKHRKLYDDYIIDRIEAYNMFVADSGFYKLKKNVSRQDRETSFRESNDRFRDAENALRDFYTRYIQPLQPGRLPDRMMEKSASGERGIRRSLS